MPPPNAPNHRRDIDGLRGLAVLAVLGFHGFREFLPWGFVGVDVFFVISGFLISGILLAGFSQGHLSLTEFYVRRVRRIFPALLLVLSAFLAAGWFVLLPEDYERLGRQVAAGGGFFANFLFWYESGYFQATGASTPLLHLWSLGIEEQFYIVWPILLLLFSRKPRHIALLSMVIGIPSFALGWAIVDSHPSAAFFSPATRIWELLVGAWLAQRLHARESVGRWEDNTRSLWGCALFVTAVVSINEQRSFPGAWAILPVAATALWLSAPAARFNRAILGSRTLVQIGLISYPLYLWHWPLLAFTQIFAGKEPSAGARLAAIAASFALAWITVQTLERWLRFGPHARMKAIGMLAAMATIVALGWMVSWGQGVPTRFPAAVRVLGSGVQSHHEWRVGACFLSSFDPPSTFDRCPDRFRPETVLVWGDSHAAALYPGLRRLVGDTAVVQRTAGSCQPLLHLDREGHPNCRPNNDRVMSEVRQNHPDAVVLAANWLDASVVPALRVTLAELRAAGVRRIVLVGRIPKWREDLPRLVFRAFRDDPMHRVPWRLPDSELDLMPELDSALRSLADEMHVAYVSPLQTLCGSGTCIARVGDEPGDLLTWDRNHLSVQGSVVMGRAIARELR